MPHRALQHLPGRPETSDPPWQSRPRLSLKSVLGTPFTLVRTQVHEFLLAAPEVPTFPGLRLTRQAEYSAKDPKCNLRFRASPSFQISPATNQRKLRNAGGPRGPLGVVVYPPRCIVT